MRVASSVRILSLSLATTVASAQDVTVIELTHTGCQFLEPENDVDHRYQPRSSAACESVNARDGAQRLRDARVLRLDAGRYTFRVTNRDVPYELGFWLRGAGALGRALLPSVSGGGLEAGVSRDDTLDLEPVEYVFSCPLNPTPAYRLVVEK